MSRSSALAALVLCVAVLSGAGAGSVSDPPDPTPAVEAADRSRPGSSPGFSGRPGPRGSARVVAALPNPAADGDRGEFVVVEFPRRTNLSGWTLSDGEDVAHLGRRTANGRVAFSPDPAVVRNRTDHPVVRANLSLSNAGERIELRHGNATVDALEYADAPERERRLPGGWRPVGATDFAVAESGPATVRAFVLPDSPGVPAEVLRSADRRILLAGYSFGSRRVAGILRRAAARGVDVRVLVDAAPVGGMARREARLLDSLARAGVEVRAFGGGRAPYDFQHAKYAVVDGRALVTTENWKPAGVGGHSSRGWGVVVDSPAVAADLARVFRVDFRRPKAVPWRDFRRNATLVEEAPANDSYPSRFRSRRLPVESVRVVVAPDNAESATVALLRNATESILIEQMEIQRGPFLRATIRAARRGVRVRILVSGAWYVREQNRKLVRALNARARREGLDLRAKVVDPRSRFGKVHAKGVVVDGDRVVVGSMNWNNHSARKNRELAVVLEGEAVGDYYAAVFRADWRGGRPWIPAGVAVLLGASLVVALAVGRRRIQFGGSTGVDPGAGSSPDPGLDG